MIVYSVTHKCMWCSDIITHNSGRVTWMSACRLNSNGCLRPCTGCANAQQLWPFSLARALRSSASKHIQVPRTNLQVGSRSFHVSAPTLWSSLPHSVRFCESLTTFRKVVRDSQKRTLWGSESERKHLKTFYFQAAFFDTPGDTLATTQRLRFNS